MTARTAEPSLISLNLSIPTDQRFRETVLAIADKVAAYVGYPPSVATRIGHSLDHAVAAVLAFASPADISNSIQLSFATTDAGIEIILRFCGCDAGGRPLSARDLERGLREPMTNGAALDSIRIVMDHVEFGQDGGQPFCRLIRQLPDDI